MISGVNFAELERCLDNIRDPAFQKVFYGTLKEMREDLVEALIDKGGDELRYKIQMIDDVLDIEDEIFERWRSDKSAE